MDPVESFQLLWSLLCVALLSSLCTKGTIAGKRLEDKPYNTAECYQNKTLEHLIQLQKERISLGNFQIRV